MSKTNVCAPASRAAPGPARSVARFGQRHGACAPFEERDAQFFFQALDVMADGALRDKQIFRGLREA